jgi:pilus assembly protein Flp/PilA
MNWKGTIVKIWCDQTGATAVEYGLILALICLAMLTALQGVATNTVEMWENVTTIILTAING